MCTRIDQTSQRCESFKGMEGCERELCKGQVPMVLVHVAMLGDKRDIEICIRKIVRYTGSKKESYP